MKSSFLSVLKFLLGWPLSLVAIFFILKVAAANWESIQNSISNADYALLFWGIVTFSAYFFLRGYMWSHILTQHGYSFRLSEVSYLWSISEIKRYIPGNIWSFLSRGVLFGEKQVPKSVIIASLFTETQLMMIGALAMGFLGLPFAAYLIPQLQVVSWGYPIIYALALLLVCAYIFGRMWTKYLRGDKKSYFSVVLPQFPPAINAFHVGISFLSFFLFGLGSYLVAASLTYLNPEMFMGFVFFFIFSFLIGYISFITPMGLGVREGVIMVGLTPLIGSSMAGVVAIFIRIMFIFSELFAMGLAYFWFHTKNKTIKKMEKMVGTFPHETALFGAIFVYITYFTTVTFLKHANFFTGRFDLGNMDQTVWNSLHGKLFMFTNPDGTEIISRMAFHADIILVFIAPLYALWQDPRTLLVLQTVVLAMGSVFVYLLAQKVLKHKNISLTFAIVYLLYPPMQYTNLYDFHAVTLATTFLLGAFYFAMEKKYLEFFIFAILAGICKEQIWLIISIFGLYFFFIQKKRVLGVSVFVGAFAVAYYLISELIPSFRGGHHFAMEFYADFGDSPTDLVKAMIFSPQKVLAVILEPGKLEYLKQLTLPLGFYSVFAPLIFIFAGPDLLINLLSNNKNFQQIYYQYTATITPFIFIAAVYGAYHLRKKFFVKESVMIVYLLGMAFLGAYLYGPLPGAKTPSLDMFTKTQIDRAFIANYLASIPSEKSVATTNNIGAHLTHRPYLFTIPTGMEKADVIAFLLGDRFASPSPEKQYQMVDALKKNPAYILRVERGNFFVFEKIY